MKHIHTWGGGTFCGGPDDESAGVYVVSLSECPRCLVLWDLFNEHGLAKQELTAVQYFGEHAHPFVSESDLVRKSAEDPAFKRTLDGVRSMK